MELGDSDALQYKRSHFVTRLPVDRFYSPSHCWLHDQNGAWRIGLTTFGTRMLGEIVDFSFEVQPGAAIRAGEVLGWIEGLKAVSDLLCVVDGAFCRSNPELLKDPEAIARDCYGRGWLYEATGKPAGQCTNVEGYKAMLDTTIDKLVEGQGPSEQR